MQPTEPVDPKPVEVVEVHPVIPWLTAERRAWVYRVVTAVSLIAAGYGIIDDSQAGLWVGLVAAFIGAGTATAHTPSST